MKKHIKDKLFEYYGVLCDSSVTQVLIVESYERWMAENAHKVSKNDEIVIIEVAGEA